MWLDFALAIETRNSENDRFRKRKHDACGGKVNPTKDKDGE